MWIVVKDNGNNWIFSQWTATNATLSPTINDKKIDLGNGWYLYYNVRTIVYSKIIMQLELIAF